MISIQINISDLGIYDSDERGWRGAAEVVAEGNNLNELIDDATIFWIDQDGGEVMQTALVDEVIYLDRISGMIRDEYRNHIRKDSPRA